MARAYVILRRPEGLSRVTLERDDDVRLVERPGAGDAELEAAFARLGAFDPDRRADREALARVWTQTLPAPDGWPRAAVPPAVEMPKRPRATAAHPRGYRGTIEKPPKAARPRLALGPYLDRWSALTALGAAAGPDPYAAVHHGEDASLDALAPGFRAYVLPLVRGAPWTAVKALARAFDAIGPAPAQAAAIAEAAGADAAAGWIECALDLHPALRDDWLAALCASDALAGIAPAEARLGLARIAALGDGFGERARIYLSLLAAGASAAYAASGLELASEGQPWRFEARPPGRGDVASLVRAVTSGLALQHPEWEGRYYTERSWIVAASWPQALEAIVERDFGPATARAWLHSVIALATHPMTEEARRTIAEIILGAPAVDALFPRHFRFAAVDDPMHDEPRIGAARARRALRIASRLGRRPLSTQNALWLLLRRMRLEDLDDRALDAAVAETRSHAVARRVRTGLDALVSELPLLVERLVSAQPRALFRTCRELGVMRLPRIRDVLRRAASDPRFEPPPALEGWRALASTSSRRDPLSRVLREHLTGERALTPGQLERHLRRAVERWDLVRLDVVEEHAARELRRAIEGAPEGSDAMDHALALLASIGENRRGLARLLRAYAAGDRDVVERHPASRAWLARHPHLDPARWREGIVLDRAIGGRALRLAIEQDPLEVLRLGTYVGSCRALGGGFDVDAAGIALDVNKRVVYARDAAGSVVARQLVAVSEAGELVGYWVYPAGVPASVAALFREYDERLAAHLGLPLCRHHEYRVANVLSTYVWDDGLWGALEERSRSE